MNDAVRGAAATRREFFTLDRRASLKPGQVLVPNLDFAGRRFYPLSGHYDRADLETFARSLFPGGLSEHGKNYLLDELIVVSGPHGPEPLVPNTPAVELVAELVRRMSFPERPSRMACVFAWSTLGEARRFRASHGSPGSAIYRVSCEVSSRHDMTLLYLGGTILGSWLFATRYWPGEAGPTPFWEELLVPPVEVLDRAE